MALMRATHQNSCPLGLRLKASFAKTQSDHMYPYVTIVPDVSGEERWKKSNSHIFDSQITLLFASFVLLLCRVCDNSLSCN